MRIWEWFFVMVLALLWCACPVMAQTAPDGFPQSFSMTGPTGMGDVVWGNGEMGAAFYGSVGSDRIIGFVDDPAFASLNIVIGDYDEYIPLGTFDGATFTPGEGVTGWSVSVPETGVVGAAGGFFWWASGLRCLGRSRLAT